MNRFETALMNNPVRRFMQRRLEGPRLRAMGGPVPGGHVLEVGCGQGTGAEIILRQFGARRVDAFDLDPAMVRRAAGRLERTRAARLWVGDVTAIPVPTASYDAVFDFGIIHHVPDWRTALREIARVLKPGGVLYAEEVLAPFIEAPVIRHLFLHPLHDRFDAAGFAAGLAAAGLVPTGRRSLLGIMAWFVAHKPAMVA